MKKFLPLFLLLAGCDVFFVDGVITKISITERKTMVHSINDYCTITTNSDNVNLSAACANEKQSTENIREVKYNVTFFVREVRHEETLLYKEQNGWANKWQDQLPLPELGKKLTFFTGGVELVKTGCKVNVYYRYNGWNGYLTPPVVDASKCAILPAENPATR